MPDTSRPTTRDLVLVPAIVTLAVTVLRLVGELQQWSPRLFSRAGGGGAALVGISWLPLIFGVYFAARPKRFGRRIKPSPAIPAPNSAMVAGSGVATNSEAISTFPVGEVMPIK